MPESRVTPYFYRQQRSRITAPLPASVASKHHTPLIYTSAMLTARNNKKTSTSNNPSVNKLSLPESKVDDLAVLDQRTATVDVYVLF